MGDWNDDRANWVADWVMNSTKMKSDKWKKMVSQEELKQIVLDFFEKKENRVIVFYFDAKDSLIPQLSFPTSLKKKAVYFMKPHGDFAVSKDNVKELQRGDISAAPIDQLAALVDGVFLPLLGSTANNANWPKVVSEDVVNQANGLKSSTQVTVGQIKGQTLLPLPTGSDSVLSEHIDKGLVHAVETAVIEWAHQVFDVLKKDSAQPLLEGLNPGALVELDFWTAKKANLIAMTDQLNSAQILQMKKLLVQEKSAYASSLNKVYDDIAEAAKEATDICKFLGPMRKYLEELEEFSFENFPNIFISMMKTLTLIWKHSAYYNTARRVVVLLREILNMFIDALKKHVEPLSLFKLEPREGLEKVNVGLAVMDRVREVFEDYRKIVNNEANGSKWEFASELVFSRFSAFNTRLLLIKNVLVSCDDYSKLEKVEVSAEKLSTQLKRLFELQVELYAKWVKATGEEGGYDCLNPTSKQFEVDYEAFLVTSGDIDRRIGRIAAQAFADAAGLEGHFKIIFGFQGLLERPSINVEVQSKYPVMMTLLDNELQTVKEIFDRYKDAPRLGKNMPRTAGSLKFAKELRDRIFASMKDFPSIKQATFETVESKFIFQKCTEMIEIIDNFEVKIYKQWTKDVQAKSDANLNLALLQRDPNTQLIRINFDPQLVAVLREVKYMEMTKSTADIPESAVAIFARNESFRQQIGNLDITATEYNRIRTTILDVERPLIAQQLQDIDAVIERAISELNWNSAETAEYCLTTKTLVEDLSNRIQKSKANIDEILATLAKWFAAPLWVRDKNGIIVYDDKDKHMAAPVEAIRVGGERFHVILDSNLALFKANGESVMWQNYVDYLDLMVLDGLFNTIHGSIGYLLDNTDAKCEKHLMEGKMSLNAPDIKFEPAVSDKSGQLMLNEQIKNVLADIFSIGAKVTRLSKHSGKTDYKQDLEKMEELIDMKEELLGKVLMAIDKILVHEQSLLDDYSTLWTDDQKEFMRQFLLYNHVLTTEEIEAAGENEIPLSPPTSVHFKQNIDKFNGVAETVAALKDTVFFDGWYRVDVKLFRSALQNTIKKWSNMFIKYLTEHITTSLADLDAFIKDASQGLKTVVPEGNYDKLVLVMGYLNKVTDRTVTTDSGFTTLNEMSALLSSYAIELPSVVTELLSNLPAKWSDTKKFAETVMHSVAPAQADEVAKLRRRINQFDVKNFEFREDFTKRAPIRFDAANAYDRIDKHYIEYMDMEVQMNSLQKAADLFAVKLPEFKQLKTCRKELGLLKTLWDMIALVRSQFDEWETTLWKSINVEVMEIECKKLVAEIRGLDKDTRAWEAFNGIDGKVKNMITSLGAVGLLQSPAIRDRHWQQVMNTTGVRIDMSDKTTLSDLLALQLHNFEDAVAGIVDRANKEQGMEKMLVQLDETWLKMFFEYTPHANGTPMLKASEELIEILEENQVQLQNVLTSKYIAFFLEQVSGWQRKLSTADAVIEIWFEVQRTWSHLQSIFIGSEDIRAQLPEDSKRFDGIDTSFKEIMKVAATTPNVVEATNKPGLNTELERLQKDLTLCEKALQEYLETKRLAFPRFYFISSSDLLDILSNGNQPDKVAKQLDKLFCVMCNLRMDPNDSRLAIGMISLDTEYVKFTKPIRVEGRVECWLMDILRGMENTLRDIMAVAVPAYEDKPRSEWVFDFPAQMTLVGTQVWWATEVNIAFARLEEGYENAMKEYSKKAIGLLNELIVLLQGKLSEANRVMLQTVCTVDVHSRDVVLSLIQTKAESSGAFLWLSQLRHNFDEKDKLVKIQICDARFTYSYEYLGNLPRLVITPLTDRCYITLTQSLHLIMSGAPAGPAGTGKTETTKDLSRNLGIMIYVFNCSEQMDYKSVGNIYKGLAQAGSWGCFDEFNRILVEVLSVIAVQVKTIQDAVRAKKLRFNFLGEEVSLCITVGLFITMNPGYAGRTELPDNLKALFRPCAMVVPDYGMICEIMLVSEGFLNAKLLGRKFITLYSLNRDLLSKQDHYDWGLRAIKSVLVVAGSLKRADPDRIEDEVLMRALRDFNIPKIVNDDLPVFMGLIADLFPGLNAPRKRNMDFEAIVRTAIADLKLQAEDSFVLKIVQLQELLVVRHSVFVLGSAGTGKSGVLKSLNRTYALQKRKPIFMDLNPKAVTTNELFGFINPATREWCDGLFSSIMRDLAALQNDYPKWIVLDGDIDTLWVESLNTTMDDNKILTLASNERISLKPPMRLVFEIANLTYASPATVSRAGILFVNPTDLGWNPCVTSWIDGLDSPGLKANLMILFEKYVPPCLIAMRDKFKTITPISEWSMVNALCKLCKMLLTQKNTPEGCNKDEYELYFAWAAVWAFGSGLFKDQLADYREEFSKWWVVEFKTVKFPSTGTVFDYYINDEKKFTPWTQLVPAFSYDSETPISAVLVPTVETVRLHFWMDMLIRNNVPVLLVGSPGTGKTAVILNKLAQLDEDWLVAKTSFNHYSIHHTMQAVLEAPLEKKAGKNYGPPGTKKLVYFVDDLNMPQVDSYGTASPHTIMRQHIDYNHWYDRVKKTLKIVTNTQYIAAMNPKAGSFTVDPRLQRHFTVFALSAPSNDACLTIYRSLLTGHLTSQKFAAPVLKISDQLVDLAVTLHNKVTSTFLPTAIKFHYLFNLRDLSNIFTGVIFSQPESFKLPMNLVRLFLHESDRVYCDKLVDTKDIEYFASIQATIAKEKFPDLEGDKMLEHPRIHCHFAVALGDNKYQPIKDWGSLSNTLGEALNNYNEINAQMNLVLFRDAMQHICRINRILEAPRASALLVGVGGSGKQSLSRLAASISSLETFQIALAKGYGVNELKVDLGKCFVKTGQKNIGVMFLMTDAQIADEKFLVLINDLLSSGTIADLFPEDEKNDIIDGVRNEVKSLGMEDTNANCWIFFQDRVRKLLKVVLCFSPVGDMLRLRARRFPGLVNCTTIDWFHEWPQDALISVGQTFLEDSENIPKEFKPSIGEFMAYVHTSVNELSKVYLANERRYNYTTPKSFLELIKLYRGLLDKKYAQLQGSMDRMENGLTKLKSTGAQVDDLKEKLKAQEIELAQKNAEADALIERVGIETEKVNKEKAIADEEGAKVKVINDDVSAKATSCAADLAKAEPALVAAQAALNTLNKGNLTELKSFGSPPDVVVTVVAAVTCLLTKGKISKDRSWKAGKLTMGDVGGFLNSLLTYDKENIPSDNLREAKVYIADKDNFNFEFVKGKSLAAAGLCAWVINIVMFYEVFCDVEPKRILLAEANATLEAAQLKLKKIMEKIKALDDALGKLTAEFQAATDAKLKCQREADATALTINLANRLVGGLASEKIRWGDAVTEFKKQELTLPGDIVIVAAFLSYSGCFSKRYRTVMIEEKWIPFLKQQAKVIPITEGLDPLSILTDNSTIAKWQNEGLPSDRVSTENASILTNAQKWPLIIDPQEQGIKWIKQREADLKVVRLGQKGYLDKIERAISNGDCVLIENCSESIDPVLDNLLGRVTIKKGRAIIIGDKEVEYNPKFRLILHTKLANPHYKPEQQAQCTLINFTVTQLGLEDQLLADVVTAERLDLQELKAKLTKDQNQYMITLKELEDGLLARLSSAEGDFLKDVALVESLENTKKVAAEISEKVAIATVTEGEINVARELYRPAACRAALLYFIINMLDKIHPMYQVSLKAFNVVFARAIKVAEKDEDVMKRVLNVIDTISFNVFVYTTRGLFERDKLIFTAQMAFQIMAGKGEIVPAELDFLLRSPSLLNQVSPCDFLTNAMWGSVKALSSMETFTGFDKDIEGAAKRWKKFVEAEAPEKEKFPGDWKNKTAIQQLCMLRTLRPDRMLYAMRIFVGQMMGEQYTRTAAVEFVKSFEETTSSTGVFFILSPGVNPILQVEKLGKIMGWTYDKLNYHPVSLGQGQEIVAEKALDLACKEGHWVVLENIHLVQRWLPMLEKKLEECTLDCHPNFRYFLTAEPAASIEYHVMPAGILQGCIKITNEPPSGMLANVHASLNEFNQDTLEMCAREVEFKKIWFSLCYFHAVMIERRKFGSMGWNRGYPFNRGDLAISVNVLFNYLEANSTVPWVDLRYLFGEIMYGGHITDNLDRRLCATYLAELMKPEMLDMDIELCLGFNSPNSMDYVDYHTYLDEQLPPESPYLYGLHPNAEIEFLTVTSTHLFSTVMELQPRSSDSSGAGGGPTREEKIKITIDEMMEKIPDEFNMNEMNTRCPVDERTPYAVVAFQECARMNLLLRLMKRALKELDLGLKGELTVTQAMEVLGNELFLGKVPSSWNKLAYPSTKTLTFWYAELLDRIKFIEAWCADFQLPATVWLGGLFNPQSFLTAIMQQTARKNEWPLDKMFLQCEVTKKYGKEDFATAPREGSYCIGVFIEGARWDVATAMIQDSKLKELLPLMPVLFIKAIPVDKEDTRGTYACPVFKTKERGRANEQVAVGCCPGFVWSLNLKTKLNPNKWILAGVSMILSD